MDRLDDPLAAHQGQLDDAACTVFDDDGTIAVCSRAGDARFILESCAAAELAAASVEAQEEPPNPPIWCRDEIADGTEDERLLCDGNNQPIIKLLVDHPRSAFNEDFILISRNAWVEA